MQRYREETEHLNARRRLTWHVHLADLTDQRVPGRNTEPNKQTTLPLGNDV